MGLPREGYGGEAAAAATGQAPASIVFGAAGSAKLAHALGMHGLQVLGVLAIGLGMRPTPIRTQVWVTSLAAAGYAAVFAAVIAHRVHGPGLDLAHRAAGAAHPGRGGGGAGRIRLRSGAAAPRRQADVAAGRALSESANLIGLFSVGFYATQRRALWGPAIMLPGIAAYFVGEESAVPPVVPAVVVFGWLFVWAVGYAGARRRDRQEDDQRLMRRDAVLDERHRVARELHDLIGHTMSVMLVRTGAARVIVDRDPDTAREILAGVEQTGREELDELDRVLGVLRRDDGTDMQPGLADLPRLVERMAEAGMTVTVRVHPAQPHLPGSIDLSAYRIVQEALTNAFRHGSAASAAVVVRCDGRGVDVEVVDDGIGPKPGYRPRRGLLGIAERAAVFGGTVEHGRSDEGGFRVRAVIPLP